MKGRIAIAVIALAGLCSAGAVIAPAAGADDTCLPENGCVPGVVAPPIPPDEAGDPQAVTIGATQIPDLPPYVNVPMPPYSGPPAKACKAKHHRSTSARKGCKRKRK
jgi:hypothetical protein